MSDAPVRLCPACGAERVERLISAGGGIVFKGSGFYATDYREPRGDGGASGEAKTSDDAPSGSEKGASTGSETGSSGPSEGDAAS